ncbi:MAG: methyltransferase domain-containing protein [Bacteroidia bacterium]|nr:methyltransferase domain-containing protein [Bacteroidia bacterium]MDW8346843.1 methyltransferase domain-containing protein [Bacteroidia bacterium]
MWYKTWFDSPYYHLLYEHRDTQEAAQFIDVLVNFLLSQKYILPACSWLDTACGTGRHALYLAQKGFQVTGIDLSEHNIAQAKQQSKHFSNVEFFVQDIRKPLNKQFDVVSNLFTSFGYFEHDEENFEVIKNLVHQSKNLIILDYFNADYVVKNLISQERIVKKGLTFYITRSIVDNTVLKEIAFEDKGRAYFFQERVKLYFQRDLYSFFCRAGASVISCWGDYQGNSEGKRCILIAQRV